MTAYILISIILFALAATANAATPAETLARTVTAVHKCQKQIGQKPTPFKWHKHSRGYRMWQNARWQQRLEECRQWNWPAWLPAHWQRVGKCETRLNWRHSNSSYQGAFGFAISSWDGYKLPGYPDEAWQATPWQQYQVALQIYRRFGMSGWGCKG